jgi:hypothetical protein
MKTFCKIDSLFMILPFVFMILARDGIQCGVDSSNCVAASRLVILSGLYCCFLNFSSASRRCCLRRCIISGWRAHSMDFSSG